FQLYGHHSLLYSFPTRRSSDLLVFPKLMTAQDIHFSQMGYSPLTLNPALAGANYDLQVNVNYRNQWNSVAVPFQTIGASVDTRLDRKSTRLNSSHVKISYAVFC